MTDLRPFKPGEYIDNKDGTFSTERSRTVLDPYGQYINVPSLWKDEKGNIYDFDSLPDDELADIASMFELKAKQPWARFGSVDEAVKAAESRSADGGAFQQRGLLAPPRQTDAPIPRGGLFGLIPPWPK